MKAKTSDKQIDELDDLEIAKEMIHGIVELSNAQPATDDSHKTATRLVHVGNVVLERLRIAKRDVVSATFGRTVTTIKDDRGEVTITEETDDG